jgi:hypothetical protein
LRPFLLRHEADALGRLGRYDEANSALDEAGASEAAILLRARLLMAQLKYQPALQQLKQISSTSDNARVMAMLSAEIEAKLDRPDAARALITDTKPEDADEKEEWQRAQAEIAIASRKYQEAEALAAAQIARLTTHGQRDSETYWLCIAVEAAEGDKNSASRTNNAKIGLDTLHDLQQAWSPEQYASFSARPDIRYRAALFQKNFPN